MQLQEMCNIISVDNLSFPQLNIIIYYFAAQEHFSMTICYKQLCAGIPCKPHAIN